MGAPTTEQEVLYSLAVMAGVLRYCPKHETVYKGLGDARDVMPYFDRHIDEARKFFASPVAFYIAMKRVLAEHTQPYCPGCTNAVGFV